LKGRDCPCNVISIKSNDFLSMINKRSQAHPENSSHADSQLKMWGRRQRWYLQSSPRLGLPRRMLAMWQNPHSSYWAGRCSAL
jgi:hypothetical protein